MAYEVQGMKFTAIAGEDLSSAQYCFVKISATSTVVKCAALTDIPCGILQNNPTSGGAAEVLVSGISKVKTAAASAAGILIGTDGNALAIIVDPDGANDYYYVGQMLVATGAANGIGSALVNCANPVIQSGS